jgi:drug/metabolite transporter (DMT)-like permease
MVGVVSAMALAAIHLIEMPEEFEEMPYLGVLFGVGGILLVTAAVALMRRSGGGGAWATGSLVAVGMFVGYCLSRTLGLPGMEPEAWGEPLGILALVLEVVFVAAAAVAYGARSQSRETTMAGTTS